jgi:hypothetical protein
VPAGSLSDVEQDAALVFRRRRQCLTTGKSSTCDH